MFAKFLVLVLFLFSINLYYGQQNVRININLQPTQIISIHSTPSTNVDPSSLKHLEITNTTGFQIKISHHRKTVNKKHSNKTHHKDIQDILINKGAIEKKILIEPHQFVLNDNNSNQDIDKQLNYLVYTIISK